MIGMALEERKRRKKRVWMLSKARPKERVRHVTIVGCQVILQENVRALKESGNEERRDGPKGVPREDTKGEAKETKEKVRGTKEQ